MGILIDTIEWEFIIILQQERPHLHMYIHTPSTYIATSDFPIKLSGWFFLIANSDEFKSTYFLTAPSACQL